VITTIWHVTISVPDAMPINEFNSRDVRFHPKRMATSTAAIGR
jgi:hypothetical protein